jgi:hypothetical protein
VVFIVVNVNKKNTEKNRRNAVSGTHKFIAKKGNGARGV